MKAPSAAGRRDVLVTVEQVTDSVGASGFPVQTWTTLAQIWMGRQAVRASERFVTHQDSAWADTRWYAPYRADLDPDLVAVTKTRRLVVAGRAHDIVAAHVVDRRYVELTTLAKVDA